MMQTPAPNLPAPTVGCSEAGVAATQSVPVEHVKHQMYLNVMLH
jgi:hypothetical protein